MDPEAKRIAKRIAKARRRIAAGKREHEETERIARLEARLRELNAAGRSWRS